MIELFEWTLTGTSTPGQSGPGGNGNEEVLHIPKSSRTGTSPSDGLVSYPGHSLGESYTSANAKLADSTDTQSTEISPEKTKKY